MRKEQSSTSRLSNEEIKRHMSALSEDFQDKVRGVAEHFLDLKKDIKGLKGDVVGLRMDTTEIKATLNSHTEMIGQLVVDMTEVKNGLKRKVSLDDFAGLEKRVTRLEVSFAKS